MSVAAQIIIPATTAAQTSGQIQRSVNDGPFSVVSTGLGTSETVTVQVLDASTGTWVNVPTGIASQLTSALPMTSVSTPGIYRVVKTATAAAVGVALYSV